LKVVIQLLLRCTDITLSTSLVTWSTGSTEDLTVSVGVALKAGHTWRTSNTDRSTKAPFELSYTWVPLITTAWAGKLTPQAKVEVQQSTCHRLTSQLLNGTYLDGLILKHPLHHIPITPKHTSMMYTEPSIEQFFHLLVPTRTDISPVDTAFRMVGGVEKCRHSFFYCLFFEFLGCIHGLFSGVDENHDLMTFLNELRYLIVSCDRASCKAKLTLSKTTWSMFRMDCWLLGFPATPIKCCSRGTGLNDASKKNRPWYRLTLRVSCKLGVKDEISSP